MTLFDVSCFGKRRERHESLNNEPAQAENVEIRDRRSGEGVTERESEGGTEGAGTLAARNALPQESRTAGRHRPFALHEADDRAGLRLAEGAEPVQIRVTDALQPPLVRAPGIDREFGHGAFMQRGRIRSALRKEEPASREGKEQQSVFRSAKIRFFSRRYALRAGKIRTAETAFPVQRRIRPARAAAKARKNVPAAAVAAGTEASFPGVAENVSGASEAGPTAATPRTGRGGSRRSCSSLRA